MKIKFDGKKWFALSSYDERHIPKNAGMRWDSVLRHWWTADTSVVRELEGYWAEGVAETVTAAESLKTKKIELSYANDSTLDIPRPVGLEYMGFQKAGIAYARERAHCLIADEMGLGKTVQALGLINIESPSSVLIVCPASLKINWAREAKKWLVDDYEIQISNGVFSTTNSLKKIIICNYDILSKHSETIKVQTWDLVIYDESHYLKNSKAIRTQVGLSIPSKKKLFLTGTPVMNRPIELHPVLRAAGVDFAQNWYRYVERYCAGRKTRWGWETSGSSNTAELGEKLREKIMVRREKSQVLTELPEKIRQIITLPTNGASSEITAEKKAWTDYEQHTAAARAKLAEMRRQGKKADDVDYKKAVEEMRSASAEFGEITKLRHATALKKVDYVVDAAVETVASSGCCIVFAHHRDVLDGIVAGLRVAGLTAEAVSGETAIEERQRIVDDFQAGKIQVFVGSIMACGVGLTLTRTSNVIFAELEWTPSAIAQAEDRAHRIGQKNSVLVQLLVFDGSIDALLAKKIVEKEEIIDSIMQ